MSVLDRFPNLHVRAGHTPHIPGTLTGAPSLPPGALLAPGRYLLRNLDLTSQLPIWPSLPVTGQIHVGWVGNTLVETWVMYSSYQPVNSFATGGVALNCVSLGAPGPVAAFLAEVRALPAAQGAVMATWSQEGLEAEQGPQAPTARALARAAIPLPPRKKPQEQLLPGEAELVGLTPAGVCGVCCGHMFVTVSLPAPNWIHGQFVENWGIYAGHQPPAAGQALLLRPAPQLGQVPPGTVMRAWTVQYSPI